MKLAPSPSPSSGFILKGRSTCQLLGLATLEAHTHTPSVALGAIKDHRQTLHLETKSYDCVNGT